MDQNIVEMLFKSDKEGKITPLVMKIEDNDSTNGIVKVKLQNVLFLEEKRLYGKRLQLFSCQAQDQNRLKQCQLGYEVNTCIWKLIEIQ